jgi:hypothetical protein
MNNLPDGITDTMIPGNTPENAAWDELYSSLDSDAERHALSDVDCFVA